MTIISTRSVKAIRRLRAGRIFFTTGLAVAGYFLPGLAFASFDFDPTAALIETYTDNVTLAAKGNEIEDFVTQIDVGFTTKFEESFVEGQAAYLMQNFIFAENSDGNRTFHQADALTKFELLREKFFFDADATVSQGIVDPTAPIPTSNLPIVGNRADLFGWRLRPYWEQRFAGDKRFLLSFAGGEVNYLDADINEDELQDFAYQILRSELAHDFDPGDFGWRLRYQKRRAKYERIDAYRYQQAGLQVGIPIARSLSFLVGGGGESNYLADPFQDDMDEGFWDVGLSWGPDSRTVLEGLVGDRFYGTAYQFKGLREQGRFTFDVAYNEGPTAEAIEFTDRPALIDLRPGDTGLDVTGPIYSPYLQKLWEGRIRYEAPRTRLGAEIYAQKREYPLQQRDDEDDMQYSAFFDYSLTARLDFQLRGRWAEFSVREDDFDPQGDFDQTVQDELISAIVGLSRKVGTRSRLSLRYRYEKRNSVSRPDREYTENEIEIGFYWNVVEFYR